MISDRGIGTGNGVRGLPAPSGAKRVPAEAFPLQLAPGSRTLVSQNPQLFSLPLRAPPNPSVQGRSVHGCASDTLAPKLPVPRICRAGVGESRFRRGLGPAPSPLHFTPAKEGRKIPEERLEARDGWGGESVHSFLPLPPPLGLSLLGGLGPFS